MSVVMTDTHLKRCIATQQERDNCWICGEYGHRPAPVCLVMYEPRRKAAAITKGQPNG